MNEVFHKVTEGPNGTRVLELSLRKGLDKSYIQHLVLDLEAPVEVYYKLMHAYSLWQVSVFEKLITEGL